MYIYVFDMIHRNLKSVHHPLSRSFRDSTQEICSPIVYRLRSFWPIASVNLTQLWITMSPLVPWFSMILLYYRWLVVLTILKNISQLGLLFPIYGKIKNVPNHQHIFDIQWDIQLAAKVVHLHFFVQTKGWEFGSGGFLLRGWENPTTLSRSEA